MGKDALLRLNNTILFKALLSKEKEENGNQLLAAKVESIVRIVSPLLDRIPENMSEFTLHDPNHSAKIVEIMAKIIPQQTLTLLNPVEITLLILSAYLHDIGMTCDRDEKEKIIKESVEFSILFKSDIDKYNKFNYYINQNDHRSATFIEDQIFTEYLRRNHVRRSSNYIKEKLSNGEHILAVNDIPFWKLLIALCDGHGQPVESLKDDVKWPRQTLIGESIVNVQYLSLILRLADILDLDPERTPKIIYEFVNPQNPISIIEWKKHRAIVGHSINPDKILFEAECSSPEVERALRQFMEWIELERKQTIGLLSQYQDDISKRYILKLIDPISEDRIRSDGSYISSDLKFHIHFERVMDLLMGQKLYKNPTTALRELLQNSIDAIKIRESIYVNKDENFSPKIKIVLDDERLLISDNGMGMDAEIFNNFFLQVGKSFYSSPIFYGRFSEIDVTSEFGIGVLSVFMVANSLIVESRREPDDPLSPPEPILFEIPTAFSFSVQRKSQRKEIGTTITLSLKNKNIFTEDSILNILEQLIPHPPYPIEIQIHNKSITFSAIAQKPIPTIDFNSIRQNTGLKAFVLNDFRHHDPFFSYSILEFRLSDNETNSELSDIQGKIAIVNSSVMNWYSQVGGNITQRNFRIGYPETNNENGEFVVKITEHIKALFPNWTNFYCDLNFTKNACLSVTPDRTDFIEDAKYIFLKQQIEAKVIKELQRHIDQMAPQINANLYIDFLLSTGFIGQDLSQNKAHFTKEAKKFLSVYISFPVLKEDGKIVRMSAKEIDQYPTIGIVNRKWDDQYTSEVLQFVKRHNILLLIPSKMHFGAGSHRSERIISALIGNEDKLLEPHTVLTAFMPRFEIELIKVNGAKRAIDDPNNVHAISYDLFDNARSILLMPRQSIEIYPIFNSTHPLMEILFDVDLKYKTTEAAEIKSELASNIMKILQNSLDSVAAKDPNLSKKLVEKGFGHSYHNFFEFTSEIFIKDSQLLSLLKTAFKEFWNAAIKLKLIPATTKMPKITEHDFLHYWSKPN